ncbi:hypothetical protein ACSTS3_16755 [Aquimarina muelleri]|uniref:hypothetical protein n=1 Tax=Aquimarina muelleri TaxID=279356 RepID=UPI003F683DC4
MGRVWFTDHPHISATFEDLTIVTPRINNAYFAQKVVTAGSPAQGDTAATAPTVAFNEIHQGILGRDIYIIVETENFIPLNQNILSTERASLTVTLKTADCNLTGTAEQTLQITDGTAAIDSITVQVGDTTALNDSNGDCPYGNVDEFIDTAIIKVSLRPDTRAVFDAWAENISNAGQDLPAIEIEIAHEDENMIVAYGPEENPQGVWVASGRFMNTDGHRFKLQLCYCGRDIPEQEVKDIIIALRKLESSVYQGSNKENLFFRENCEIPSNDKTFARFTEELNNTFNKYDINTCLRKMHFLAQVYHETDRLRTTKEYNENAFYAPWIGRGLMQLTWESNYENYKAYSSVDCITDSELIANNITNAFDSGGWYWKQGVVLNTNSSDWTPPSSAPSYVTSLNPSYSKNIIMYEKEDGATASYGTIDLNLIADDDYVDVISWLVNGGGNGLLERQNYLSELKEIFEYENSCKNYE